MRGLTPRKAYLQFRAWQIERNLRKRARAFTLIPGDKDKDEGDHTGYLH
jgi:hypothetical protein